MRLRTQLAVVAALAIASATLLGAAALGTRADAGLRFLAGAAGLTALLAAAVLLALWRRLGAGLRAIEDGARRISAGDLGAAVGLSGRDELADVGARLDAMAGALREEAAARDRLMAALAERTDELEQSRAELARQVAQLEAARTRLGVTDRLAAVGKLARGLTHEINNPLAVVLANIDFVAEELPGRVGRSGAADELLEALVEAGQACRRVAQIVADLKAFAREGGAADDGPADLAVVLDHVQRLVGHEVRARARFLVGVPGGPILVQGGASKLAQVFIHLLLEAAAAIPEGRREANEVQLAARLDGTRVVVEIRDTGAEIPAAVLPHVFDPYFTPMPGFASGASGRGAGLGLAMCFGLAQAAGGTIEAESAPGKGSTFRVILRTATSESRVALRLARPDGSAPPRPRLLVIDDEPLMVATLYRTLSARFDVVPHTSPRNALALLEAGERFDAILCDLSMPELSGADFHAEVARLAPGLERTIIFLTGNDESPEATRLLSRVPNTCVRKPFDPAELTRILLDRSSAAARR
jgi:signal transduction histidine kinase/CheY-like chemotaxis protein